MYNTTSMHIRIYLFYLKSGPPASRLGFSTIRIPGSKATQLKPVLEITINTKWWVTK